MLDQAMAKALIPIVFLVLGGCMGPERSEGVYIPGKNEEVGEITVLDNEQVCVQADYDASLDAICYDVVDDTQVDPSLELGDEAQVTHDDGDATSVEPFELPPP